MTKTCLNLWERFGREYRIGFDPAYDHRNVPRDKLDPWMMTIPCHKGVIYPFGGDVLAVEVDHHPSAAHKLVAVPGVRIHQDGGSGGEITFTFPADSFDAVAAIVQPKRRRRLSPEQRERLVAVGQAALARHRHGANVERRFDERQAGLPVSSDPEAV